ncbi:MAG TPA: response regulator, partial [Chloroflexota bacterium]|nr:response regulator [Chloroflexota bacterium]
MSPKILVVDDDADLLDVLTYVFQRNQFDVVTATDGVQALEVFAREAPDLVILD